MDEFINNPLNLTMETSLQYAILILIGVTAFLIAWVTVGKMYDHRIISGKAAGSLALGHSIKFCVKANPVRQKEACKASGIWDFLLIA